MPPTTGIGKVFNGKEVNNDKRRIAKSALPRMEYSKGRYDTITKAVEWLEDNFCEWPNEPKRVEGFFDTLEEMKKDFKKAMEL